jgi:hypothetical protein
MTDHGMECLDLYLTILNEQHESLLKIHGKINQKKIDLENIKLFIIEILTKVHPLLLKDLEQKKVRSESYSLKERHRLLDYSVLDESSHEEEEVTVTISHEDSFNSLLRSASVVPPLKDFFFTIGSDSNALYLYDNWCLRDSISIVQVIKILEDRTAQYYLLTNERSGNSFRLFEERNLSLHSSSPPPPPHSPHTLDPSSFSQHLLVPSPPSPYTSRSRQSPMRLQRDDLKEICDSVSLVLAPQATLPTLVLRISIQTSRSSDSRTGKVHTLHTLLVRQDDREWTKQYRYTGPSHKHTQPTPDPSS